MQKNTKKIKDFNQFIRESVVNITEDIITFLGNKGLTIDKYLKSGTKGSIYLLSNGNCLKISDYNVDVQYQEYSYMVGIQNEHLVNIINVFKYNGRILIEMEMLLPIQFNRYKKFDHINSTEEKLQSAFLSFLNYEDISHSDIYSAIQTFISDDHHMSDQLKDIKRVCEIDDDDVEGILSDLDIMFYAQRELMDKYGLYLRDFHSQNIMISEVHNDYKMIDFL